MRTHKEIIEDSGGWRAVRQKLGMSEDEYRAKFWYFRDSIPCEFWVDLEQLGLTTVQELAQAAHRRRYLKERDPTFHQGKPGRPRKVAAA